MLKSPKCHLLVIRAPQSSFHSAFNMCCGLSYRPHALNVIVPVILVNLATCISRVSFLLTKQCRSPKHSETLSADPNGKQDSLSPMKILTRTLSRGSLSSYWRRSSRLFKMETASVISCFQVVAIMACLGRGRFHPKLLSHWRERVSSCPSELKSIVPSRSVVAEVLLPEVIKPRPESPWELFSIPEPTTFKDKGRQL